MSELAGRLKRLETKPGHGAANDTRSAFATANRRQTIPTLHNRKLREVAVPAEAPRQIPIPPPIPSPIPPAASPVSQPVAIPDQPAPAPVVPQSPVPPTPPQLKLHVEPVQAKFLKCLCAFCGGQH